MRYFAIMFFPEYWAAAAFLRVVNITSAAGENRYSRRVMMPAAPRRRSTDSESTVRMPDSQYGVDYLRRKRRHHLAHLQQAGDDRQRCGPDYLVRQIQPSFEKGNMCRPSGA
jgi:hypothetical protein